MSTHNSDQREDKFQELLGDKEFMHEVMMGKHGNSPEKIVAKIDHLIDDLIPEGGGD